MDDVEKNSGGTASDEEQPEVPMDDVEKSSGGTASDEEQPAQNEE